MMNAFRMNKLICPQDFYDYYSIPFPVKALQRKQRNKYLCSELEKLHPCFSDDCCFDSRLSFVKKGLKADVVVMQKFKLAEYKKMNGQKPVYIQELKKIPFFQSHFKRNQIIISIIFLFVLIFVLATLKIIQGQKKIEPMSLEPVSPVNYQSLAPEDAFSSIINMLEMCGKKECFITDFSWNVQGFSQGFTFSLKNLYPEEVLSFFPDAAISSVSYQDGSPLFSAQVNIKLNSANFSTDYKKEYDYVGELRFFALSNDITIIEETVKPRGIRLVLSNQSFIKMLDYISRENIPVSSVSISSQKNNSTVSIEISNAGVVDQARFFECLNANSNLFFEKAKQSVESKLGSAPSRPQKNQTTIGKIYLTDGTSIEFYKDENGKIKQK